MDKYLAKIKQFEKNWKPDMTLEEMKEIKERNMGDLKEKTCVKL